MGTPEEKIFVDPRHCSDLPDVIDDFDLDFNAGSDQWLQHVANEDNLKKFTDHTEIFIMNEPRAQKPLLVLDLDHTLLDFSSKTLQQDGTTHVVGQGQAAAMKRPYMDDFLTRAYQYYDLVVWSQTSWRWLETKLTELGMLTHPGYKFCFVLDKTSMFTITSTKRDGSASVKHHVKPLRIIWSKFPRWGSHNTAHVDDLSRNFALNLTCGLKCKAYYRKKSTARRDAELLGLTKYLVELAQSGADFEKANFNDWQDVVAGKTKLIKDDDDMEEDEKEEAS
jgi:ubiquitin-like domain-containing CTD phosphatase 1